MEPAEVNRLAVDFAKKLAPHVGAAHDRLGVLYGPVADDITLNGLVILLATTVGMVANGDDKPWPVPGGGDVLRRALWDAIMLAAPQAGCAGQFMVIGHTPPQAGGGRRG